MVAPPPRPHPGHSADEHLIKSDTSPFQTTMVFVVTGFSSQATRLVEAGVQSKKNIPAVTDRVQKIVPIQAKRSTKEPPQASDQHHQMWRSIELMLAVIVYFMEQV